MYRDTKVSSPAVESLGNDRGAKFGEQSAWCSVKEKAEEKRQKWRSGPKGQEREEVMSRESNEPRLAAIRRSNRAILMNSSH